MAQYVRCPVCGNPAKTANKTRFPHCGINHKIAENLIIAPQKPLNAGLAYGPPSPGVAVKHVATVRPEPLQITPHITPVQPTPPAPEPKDVYGCPCGAEFPEPLTQCPHCGAVLEW